MCVATGLFDDALARVDEHDGRIGRGRTREHIARVTLVPRRVGQDERPPVGGEEAVRHIDCDPLLALGAQTVRDRGKVGFGAIARDVVQVIDRERAGVEQEPADQRALAIVDRTGGGQSQQLALPGDCRRRAQK